VRVEAGAKDSAVAADGVEKSGARRSGCEGDEVSVAGAEFKIPLAEYRDLFSAEDRRLLKKFGHLWEETDLSDICPPGCDTAKERFWAVCRGRSEPRTDREILWLRYRAASNLAHVLDSVKRYSAGLQEKLDGLQAELEERDSRIKRLSSAIASLEEKLAVYEPPKTLERPATTVREICPNCCGDGGAAGHCYKCEGSGWVSVKKYLDQPA
jgi:uncharacterized protein YifE (UPF0438 family)